MIAEQKNPYVGLRPFDTNESLLFFGRNDQTLELLQRLHQFHFVAVVGSSGCGKSSLLKAGLIPALKAGYLIDDSDKWSIAIMKPGQSPLHNLVEAIMNLTHPETPGSTIPNTVEQVKEEGADVLLRLIAPLVTAHKNNFFLLVDQFEELFRFSMENDDVEKKDEAIDFVNIMLELAQQKVVPVYVVMTMRSDFIGDCAQFYGLPEAMNQSQYLVPRLNRMQLKMVIEGPAKLYGGKLNPSLTSLLLNELGKVKDELPLLQHSLMRIWDFERKEDKSGELDIEDYHNIGGIEKALSNHADEALTGMNVEEMRITKEMFQALTAIDENGRKIRRPVLISQLLDLCGASLEQLLHIIEQFIKDSRCFLIKNKTGDKGDMIIDISHESLIRQWKKLSDWVDEEGEYAAVYLQLAEAYRLHLLKKKDNLSGTELDIALDWYNTFKPTATWANRYKEGFSDATIYLKQSEQIRNDKELERLAKEKQEADRVKEEDKARQQQRRTKIKFRLMSVGIVVLSILVFFIIFLGLKSRKGEIDALNARVEATAAELRTQELLQIVLKGQGNQYKNKSHKEVVKMLVIQQNNPIENLIVPRAVASKPNNTSKNSSFLIWIDVPTFRRNEIKDVQYELCKGFVDLFRLSREPSSGFAIGYLGYGFCPDIKIKVRLVNGEEINIDFPMGEYLLRNGDQN